MSQSSFGDKSPLNRITDRLTDSTLECLRIDGASILFTDRHGGVSVGAFASANLGPGTGDNSAALAENRRRIAGTLGETAPDPSSWLWPDAEHGASIITLSESDGIPAAETVRATRADGIVTDLPGQALVIHVADCVPVALVGRTSIGAIHAGWRGLAKGVLAAGVKAMGAIDPGPITAVAGPCIGPCCYQFALRDAQVLLERYGPSAVATTGSGDASVDLRACTHAALVAAGVADIQMGPSETCTSCSPNYFSFRRDVVASASNSVANGAGDGGVTGRQALIIYRER